MLGCQSSYYKVCLSVNLGQKPEKEQKLKGTMIFGSGMELSWGWLGGVSGRKRKGGDAKKNAFLAGNAITFII